MNYIVFTTKEILCTVGLGIFYYTLGYFFLKKIIQKTFDSCENLLNKLDELDISFEIRQTDEKDKIIVKVKECYITCTKKGYLVGKDFKSLDEVISLLRNTD